MTQKTTDQLAAEFLASLEADVAELHALGTNHPNGRRRHVTLGWFAGPARVLITRIEQLCGMQSLDMSAFDRSATFGDTLADARARYGS